ncbi:hypothetical protein WR25_22031 isoform B [Diploscapter pachys]|uniref:Coiled-coil domain-containing protein n=1 Tax=Diploscapter pachys TaxID=2018661 RepID=A0A2A2J9L0_9BILA|nr:hypothetical protein WR25_22031 isoform B [Diploscapter pachys]
MPIEDDRPNFQEIKAKLRLNEDRDLAQKLQEEEYARHYERNRTVGTDVNKSREEQLREDEEARKLRREAQRPIEESDEELARRLQEEFDNEEHQIYESKEMQLQRDAELAAALAARYEYANRSIHNHYLEKNKQSRDSFYRNAKRN